MREIVERLQENRNIERAKQILESNDYKVSEESEQTLSSEDSAEALYRKARQLWKEIQDAKLDAADMGELQIALVRLFNGESTK